MELQIMWISTRGLVGVCQSEYDQKSGEYFDD